MMDISRPNNAEGYNFDRTTNKYEKLRINRKEINKEFGNCGKLKSKSAKFLFEIFQEQF